MPKLTDIGTTRKISISQIVRTGNVRADFTGIEELAASIKKNTLLQPILVKLMDPATDGEPRYELVAGDRRLTAHEWLCQHGDDFSMIEAKVGTGDKTILQLVENLQRVDLSPREREKAIYLMSEVPGVTQRDIAAELSKTEVYISRQISAYRVRQIADKSGYDTEHLDTSVMNEIQTAAEKDIPMLISYIIDAGGTVAAAKKLMADYRPPKKTSKKESPPERTEKASPQAEAEVTEKASAPPAEAAPASSETGEAQTEKELDPLKGNVESAGTRGADIKAENPDAWVRPPVKHKQVDLNDVFDQIYTYLTGLEKKIREVGPGDQAKIEGYKKEAALDIISLVQKRFED